MFASKDLFFSKPSGYQISRSVRLRSSASAYLNRTFSTPTNATIWTWSAWVKRGALTGTYRLFGASTTTFLTFNSSDQLNLTLNGVSAATSTAVFRDPSAWYHIVYQQNGSAQTIYVNSVSIATGTTAASIFNTAISHQIGAANTTNYFDGYLTEVNFIDGQALTPSSFGQTNTITGVWQPLKYTGTYGTNGFYLNFSDNSNNTATTIGKDYSGNGNNWTPNNISVTAGATYDSMLDVPTLFADGGNGRGNYCTLNPLGNFSGANATMSNGNLKATQNGSSWAYASIAVDSGKYYFETTIDAITASNFSWIGVVGVGSTTTSTTYQYQRSLVDSNGSTTSVSSSTTNDVIGVALDMVNLQVSFYKNNTLLTTAASSHLSTKLVYLGGYFQDVGNSCTFNFGQRPFTYTPPTGFVALNTQNLPTPTISNGANYMAATLYTGNGGTQSITNTVNGISFQPDFVWLKARSFAFSNVLQDTVRGITNYLVSDLTSAEGSGGSVTVTSVNSNGFSLGSGSSWNNNATTFVGWQWKAGTTSSSNTNGSITSTVSVGATQGFSVVTYTGTGANATVGHGLGVAPKMVITKNRGATSDWAVWHTSLTSGAYYLLLDTTAAQASGTTYWNSTVPTSSVFSVGTATPTNVSTNTYVAYCFSEVAGYSKFGSYTGNGSADGPFVYCGFRPRFVIIKRTDAVSAWDMFDTSRNTYNVVNANLVANSSGAEATYADMLHDILSNGFKVRQLSDNASGGTYIFAAFAENPTKFSLAR
jgi:hypothetical protein